MVWAKVHLKGNGNDKEWERRRETERAVGAGNGHWVFSHWTDICWGKRPDSFKHKRTLLSILVSLYRFPVKLLQWYCEVTSSRAASGSLSISSPYPRQGGKYMYFPFSRIFFFTFKSHNDCPLSQTLCTQPFTGRVCLVISQYTLLFCLRHWKGSCMFTQLN